ncbi:signal peptidase I [Bacilliculturomica massiliensis]|uniref:signal peptidase I n=1 Tax=Bacilliculturomica massiliensis TaxID=1917867 RepID=UPI00103122AF|nr:signal peptidase I [Bacilliculturomica massiliensis]
MKNMGKMIWDFAKTIVLALVIAFLVTSFVKPTLVSGNSMYPTIESNSYMIMSTIPYVKGMPEYGDIIVFNSHVYMENGKEKDFIKRVIGLPGDTISIHDGYVFRNGDKLEEDYINGGVTAGSMDEVVIQEDHVFVLGDNRVQGGSRDSRDPSIGQIAMEDIIGKAVLRLYPFDQIGLM